MSKSKNPEYLAERLKRTYLRKEKRKANRKEKHHRYGHGDSKCSMCDGYMSWCSCCEVWSSTCCCDYGTCQCS